MPKVEEDEVVPTVEITNHAISGTLADAVIVLTGKCPSSTYLMRMMVNATEFSVVENKTAQAASGVPVGACNSSGTMTLQYPVPNPTQARTITFKVKARLNDGRSSLEWAIRSVNYVPPASGVPGFAITAVGGDATSGGVMSSGAALLLSAGGEPVGGPGPLNEPGNILTSGAAILKTGMHGVILE